MWLRLSRCESRSDLVLMRDEGVPVWDRHGLFSTIYGEGRNCLIVATVLSNRNVTKRTFRAFHTPDGQDVCLVEKQTLPSYGY
ncbi:hypothetical protein VNO77_20612 [Canavalia gladiata]|uniref:Uncharacterized protein n=1 Tax=Canavalia gladiata TaxID=3824 RepID=A0AAN9LPK1_CANGL